MNSSFAKTFTKYLPNAQNRKKFKRQCLKVKNILEENDSIQIACKIQKLYDFYTSKNFVQVNIFIGNKMNKPIDRYNIEFKGTDNLSVYIEEKNEKFIKENTQGKQRVVIEWLPESQPSGAGDILLTMSFSSSVLTLKDTVIPLSLWSFYNFPSNLQQIINPSISAQSLTEIFREKYELMEDQQIDLNLGLFRKGFNLKDMQKFLEKLIKLETKNGTTQNAQEETVYFAGVFTVKTLLEEIGILIQINTVLLEPKMRVTLAGNEYTYFEPILDNLKFLFGK